MQVLEQGGASLPLLFSVPEVRRFIVGVGLAMSYQVPEEHPLRLLFREATAWAFRHGELPENSARDKRLQSYLSDDLLVRFLHVDRLYRLRDARGRPLADVAEMLLSSEAEGISPELRALTVQRHIGDYTLFITGLFPESLEQVRRDWRRKDSVMVQLGNLVVPFRDPDAYYEETGRRAYRKAAEIGAEVGLTEADLFAKLSEFFRWYVQLMSLIRVYLEATSGFEDYRGVIR